MYYEEMILNYPEFTVTNRILADYWDRLYYPQFQKKKDQIDTFDLNEARGALLSLYHHIQVKTDNGCTRETLLYDLVMYQGDLERYGGHKDSAVKLYQRAIGLVPTLGRAYNQIGVIVSGKDHPTALFNFLMSLVVEQPFGGARENLVKALKLLSSNTAPISMTKLTSMVLTEKLFGRRQHHGRERAALLASKNIPKDAEIHLLWLALVLEPGLLDTPDVCFLVEFLLNYLSIGISQAHYSWTLPIVHVILKGIPNFINRTKRFEHLWTPISESVATFCNEHVGDTDFADNDDLLLPEDVPFVGLEFFTALKRVEEEHVEMSQVRAARLFAFAHALSKAGMLKLYEGYWYSKTEGDRLAKKRQTGALLARQKLQVEVDQLEHQVQSRALLDSSPWYIPDFEYLMAHWISKVSLSIENKTKRYLITFAVLAELDYAKNGPVGGLARSIISRLAELSNLHDPSVKLQRLSESIQADGPRKAVGPKDSHRRKFLEAVAFYSSKDRSKYRVLSEDPDIIAVIDTNMLGD